MGFNNIQTGFGRLTIFNKYTCMSTPGLSSAKRIVHKAFINERYSQYNYRERGNINLVLISEGNLMISMSIKEP